MPSPEAQLLSEFLVAPAPLRDFMTLRQFTDVFPRAHRDNPAVKEVYRELQRLREQDIDLVRRAIADEVKRSKRLRREYASERRREEASVAGLDLVARRIEDELSDHGRKTPHTLASVNTSIDEACQSLESQIADMENENTAALAEINEVVGALSDLRQGRFAQPASGDELGVEVLATLRRLEAVCDDPGT